MAEDETGEVPKLPPDARLESLDRRLDRLQQAEAKRTAKAQGDPNIGLASWSSVSSSAVRSGARIVGWLLDRWLGTGPWLMLVMLFAGFARRRLERLRISNNTRSRLRANEDKGFKRGGRRQDRPDAPVRDRADRRLVPARQSVRLHQQRAVDADRARHDLAVHVRRDEAPARPRPLAGRGRGADRLRRRHGPGQHRARGQEISAVGLHRPSSSCCSPT